jgi:hypothetical protein
MTAEKDKEREHERSEGWGDTLSLLQASIGVYLEAKAGLLAAVGMSDSASGMSELLCIERLCIDLAVELQSAHRYLPPWIRTRFGSLGCGFDESCLYFAYCNASRRAIFVRVSSLGHGITALNEWLPFLEFGYPSIFS